MEALIVALFALVAIVFIEACYSIAVSLARGSPILAVGALAGWFALHNGEGLRDVVAVALLACLTARHVMRRR